MADFATLATIVHLHEKAFALLRWVGRQMEAGVLDMSRVHTNMSVGEAAEEWLRRHLFSLPNDCRPAEEELPAFAKLFASYLRTSFEIGRKGMVSSCGCYCPFCAYLSNAPYLKTRALSRKDRESARALKMIYLQELAREIGLTMRQTVLDDLTCAKTALAREVAMATYAKELIRRAAFISQGEGSYALWREFAWADGHPNRRFQLTVKGIDQAHKQNHR